jgi:hypothetical protein
MSKLWVYERFWVIPGEEELLEAAMRRDFEEDGE